MYTLPQFLKTGRSGAPLVARWSRICLLMQEIRVQSHIWEDPTCCRAESRARQLLSLWSRAWEPQLLSPPASTTETQAP